jgi:hypothetical protein
MKKERMRDVGGGSKPSEETVLLRREVLIYIREHGPCPSKDIAEALDKTYDRIKPVLHWLRCYGLTSFDGGAWEFVRMNADVTPAGESVTVVRNESWHLPQPVVKTVKNGVKYTYQAAPTNRWGVEVKPGAGVISYDNPGLARLAK